MFKVAILALLGVATYAADIVNLGLYHESLCPGCLSYITGALKTAWACDDWTNMVNISVYPYGNANERQSTSGEWVFTCQHGPNECAGNLVETCFINLVGFDQNQYMDFFIAYEAALEKNSRNPDQTAQTIISEGNYNVTWTQLDACITGSSGNAWEHQMALWTQQANHQYTPWITLNGKHTSTIQNECTASTLECTCRQYTGTNSCCSQFKEVPMGDVCYKDDKL